MNIPPVVTLLLDNLNSVLKNNNRHSESDEKAQFQGPCKTFCTEGAISSLKEERTCLPLVSLGFPIHILWPGSDQFAKNV